MNLTINDIRQYLTNIYQWATKNKDFDYIKLSINDCSSDDVTLRRHNLDVSLKRSRPLLNELAESIDDLDVCIEQLKSSIEKERAWRKKVERDQKLNNKDSSTHISVTEEIKS